MNEATTTLTRAGTPSSLSPAQWADTTLFWAASAGTRIPKTLAFQLTQPAFWLIAACPHNGMPRKYGFVPLTDLSLDNIVWGHINIRCMNTTAPIKYTTNLSGFNRHSVPPKFKMPSRACDSHMHIVGPFSSYPLIETRSMQPTEATLDDYLDVMKRTAIERAVIVQPSWYAKDCSCTLNATRALGANARAVVVVDADVDDATLEGLHARGARGVRLQNQMAGGTSVSSLLEIASRIKPFNWHIQIFVDTADIVDLATIIRKSPVPVVIDHMAHLRGERGVDSPGLRLLFNLMEEGNTWVKLSNTRFFPDAERLGALVAANPKRVLWGSDWPHVAFEGDTPTLGSLLDALAECVPDEATRNMILADNPGLLYFDDQ